MKKQILIILILVVILIISIFLLTRNMTANTVKVDAENPSNVRDISASAPSYHYVYTKAVCNSSNYCQDYEIVCEDNKTKSITPITGAVAQFDEEWDDPREQEDIDRLC